MNGLTYLEQRELINGFKRMLREPRRLFILAPLVFIAIRMGLPHPHTTLAPHLYDLLLRSIAVLLGLGLCVRFSIPAEPLYLAEPADVVFILPAPVAPWRHMLRRHWLTLLTYFRTLVGLLYMVTFLPVPFEQSSLILIFAVLYMILLTEVGILSYRLTQCGALAGRNESWGSSEDARQCLVQGATATRVARLHGITPGRCAISRRAHDWT